MSITPCDSCLVSLQSDIVHQSVYELVHSEDREELQRQLMWNAFLPPEYASSGGMALQDAIHSPEQAAFLERSFTVRFRCLLDNTSGFLVSSWLDWNEGEHVQSAFVVFFYFIAATQRLYYS